MEGSDPDTTKLAGRVYLIHSERRPIARLWRAGIRRPRRIIPPLAAEVATRISPAGLTHVAIGDGVSVLWPTRFGCTLHDAAEFERACPGLAWAVDVPVARSIRLSADPACSVARSAIRRATLGAVPAHDCVTIAADILRDAWVPVPRRVHTPYGLMRWLRKEGCRVHECNPQGHA